MHRSQTILLSLLLALAPAASAGHSADSILAAMDGSAAAYKGMTADLEWVTYTALVDDTSVESGKIWVRRNSAGRVDLRIAFTQPAAKDVLIAGTTVHTYQPKIKQLTEYDLSKHKDSLKQALLLGFGASGKLVREDYEVQYDGEEAVGDHPTVKLTLTPKSAEQRGRIPSVEMWVSTESWQPIQQRLDQGGGDYKLYTYTDATINPPLSDKDFELDLPKRVHRVKPQG